MKKPSGKIGMSGYRGVIWSKNASQWMARIKVHGKVLYLGFFDDPREAARAYDSACKEFGRDVSYLNFGALT